MRRSLCIILSLATLTLGVYLTSSAQGLPAPKDVDDLVAHDAEFIKKTLAKANPDKKAQRKMRLTALMIAQYAQSGIYKGNAKNAALATLRDQALDVHKAVVDGKFDDAKLLAEKLSLSAPVNKEAKLDPIALDKLEEFDNVMSMFSKSGFGMDEFLEDLTTLKNNPTDEEAKKIKLVALKVSMIGVLSQAHAPPMVGGARTVEAWKGFGKDMYKDSLELVKAAEEKKAAGIIKAAVKVNDTCKSCHDVFR
jgi:hypothetical protein